MTEKLKECPWCQQIPVQNAFGGIYHDFDIEVARNCPLSPTAFESAKDWNIRADKSPSPDAERLAKALRDCLNDIDGCEINMSNYGPDEVAAINNAYIKMYDAIEKALADFEKGGLK